MEDNWQQKGECSKKVSNNEVKMENLDSLFFPDGTTEVTDEKINLAKEVCDVCDVINECKEWALDKKIDPGIWGGLSEEERRVERRKIRKKKTGTIKKDGPSAKE